MDKAEEKENCRDCIDYQNCLAIGSGNVTCQDWMAKPEPMKEEKEDEIQKHTNASILHGYQMIQAGIPSPNIGNPDSDMKQSDPICETRKAQRHPCTRCGESPCQCEPNAIDNDGNPIKLSISGGAEPKEQVEGDVDKCEDCESPCDEEMEAFCNAKGGIYFRKKGTTEKMIRAEVIKSVREGLASVERDYITHLCDLPIGLFPDIYIVLDQIERGEK